MVLGLPSLVVSAASSALYALVAAVWLATATPRALALRASRTAVAMLAQGALQLFVSCVLATIMYAAMYNAFVPAAEAEHALHLGLCQRSVRPDSLPARVARLTFDSGTSAAKALAREGSSIATATSTSATVPPLARSYQYGVDLCLRLPESPSNVDAGTFLVSFRVMSASNRSLLAVDRSLLLRYRSDRLRSMWAYAYALPLLLGWMEEAQQHCMQLSDSFTNLRQQPAERAVLALVSPSACQLQVYEASVRFHTRLSGVTYVMSFYFFTAASIGIGGLMLVHWLALLLLELRTTADATDEAQRTPSAQDLAHQPAQSRRGGVRGDRAPPEGTRRRPVPASVVGGARSASAAAIAEAATRLAEDREGAHPYGSDGEGTEEEDDDLDEVPYDGTYMREFALSAEEEGDDFLGEGVDEGASVPTGNVGALGSTGGGGVRQRRAPAG